jgi:hypothetical protein
MESNMSSGTPPDSSPEPLRLVNLALDMVKALRALAASENALTTAMALAPSANLLSELYAALPPAFPPAATVLVYQGPLPVVLAYRQLGDLCRKLFQLPGWEVFLTDNRGRRGKLPLTDSPAPPALLDDIERECLAIREAVGFPTRPVGSPGRLRVEGRNVYLDGEVVSLGFTEAKTTHALHFLRSLLAEPGNYLSSREIGERDGGDPKYRYDVKVFKKLPEPIKSLIESKRAAGFRVRK